MTHASTSVPSGRLRELAERIVGGDPASPFRTPGLSVVVSEPGGRTTHVFMGTDGAGRPIAADTLFPLASATKLATGLALLRLVQRGLLALDEPIGTYVPASLAARAGVTIRMLLSHTSGLPLDVAPARAPLTRSLDWPAIAAACLDTPLQFPPATRVQYSNVAFGLLALAMERVTGGDFKAALESLVVEPLGIEAYIGRTPPRRPAVVDQIDSAYVGTELEPYNSEFWWRLGTPWAGMYSTAIGLLTLVRAFADDGPALLDAASSGEARTDQSRGLGGGFGTTDPFLGFTQSRRIAWPRCAWGLVVELRGDKRPHWSPPSAAASSFGQIGASGCLAWCDPTQGTAWAVLAPRTTDNGWLLRHGGAIGALALRGAAGEG